MELLVVYKHRALGAHGHVSLKPFRNAYFIVCFCTFEFETPLRLSLKHITGRTKSLVSWYECAHVALGRLETASQMLYRAGSCSGCRV